MSVSFMIRWKFRVMATSADVCLIPTPPCPRPSFSCSPAARRRSKIRSRKESDQSDMAAMASSKRSSSAHASSSESSSASAPGGRARRDPSGSARNAARYDSVSASARRADMRSVPTVVVPSHAASSPPLSRRGTTMTPPIGIHMAMFLYRMSVLRLLFWSLESMPARVRRSMSGNLLRTAAGSRRSVGWRRREMAESAAGAWWLRFTDDTSRARRPKSRRGGDARRGSIWTR
mmetsp:Transcript_36710/g.87669  ORF Transcript_36710/g.87669 Transcript_36710/m.87669 type:complete len:233 (-) Transcript_36710:1497-2195(-)